MSYVLQVAHVLHHFLYGGCCSTDDLVSEPFKLYTVCSGLHCLFSTYSTTIFCEVNINGFYASLVVGLVSVAGATISIGLVDRVRLILCSPLNNTTFMQCLLL